MGTRTFRTSLDPSSLSRTIRELKQYEAWFREKAGELNERLAVYGASVASARFTTAWYDEDHRDVSVEVRPAENGWVIVAEGADVFFIEFGAGVYFNGPEPYPEPRPPGVAGIGQYGKGKGKQNTWGYYDDSGELKITRGTPAAMPMWWATREIQQNLLEIAREVFG